ncbi:MAG: hypothetical protein ACKVTZ_07870 [Bacteroidia bacterium]
MGFFDFLSGKKDRPARMASSPLTIRYPMGENDHQKAAFHNVSVILSADSTLKMQQQSKIFQWGNHLGLLQEEMDAMWHQADKYEVVPHDNARWNQSDLQNILSFAAVDKQISEAIQAKLQDWGERLGIKMDMIQQTILTKFSPETREVTLAEDNLRQYDMLFTFLSNKLSSKEIAKQLKTAHKTHDFDKEYHQDTMINLQLYRLFWLALYHCNWLNSSYLNLMTGICMSVEAGSASIQEIYGELKSAEASFGRMPIHLPEMTLAQMQADLKQFYAHL